MTIKIDHKQRIALCIDTMTYLVYAEAVRLIKLGRAKEHVA